RTLTVLDTKSPRLQYGFPPIPLPARSRNDKSTLQGDLKAKLGIACAAILAISALLYGVRERALSGANDFIPLYVASLTVGTDGLYAVDPYIDFQMERFGAAGESLRFTRLPFYAVLLSPLRWLEYQT